MENKDVVCRGNRVIEKHEKGGSLFVLAGSMCRVLFLLFFLVLFLFVFFLFYFSLVEYRSMFVQSILKPFTVDCLTTSARSLFQVSTTLSVNFFQTGPGCVLSVFSATHRIVIDLWSMDLPLAIFNLFSYLCWQSELPYDIIIPRATVNTHPVNSGNSTLRAEDAYPAQNRQNANNGQV